MSALRALLAVPTVTLSLTVGECALEHAAVWPVPPATFKVVEIHRCGAIECIRRYFVVDGVIRRDARVCGAGDKLVPAPDGLR